MCMCNSSICDEGKLEHCSSWCDDLSKHSFYSFDDAPSFLSRNEMQIAIFTCKLCIYSGPVVRPFIYFSQNLFMEKSFNSSTVLLVELLVSNNPTKINMNACFFLFERNHRGDYKVYNNFQHSRVCTCILDFSWVWPPIFIQKLV